MRQRLLGGLMAFVMAASVLLIQAPGVSASAWCDASTVYNDPGNGTVGQNVSFFFKYVNGLTIDYVEIGSFLVDYSWDATQYNLGSASVAPNGGSAEFAHHEVLPQTPKLYSIWITILAYTASEPYGSSCVVGPIDFSADPLPLTADLTANVTSGTAPLAVRFQTTVGGGVAPFSYAWTLGDGATDLGAIVNHTYASAGNYTVNVTVSDAASHTVTQSVKVRVTPTPPPTIGRSVGPGPPPWIAYVGLAAAVAAGVGASLLMARRRRRTKTPSGPLRPEGPTQMKPPPRP